MKKTGLYIHIPFCVKKCDYCDFLSFGGVDKALHELYCDALISEINRMSEITDVQQISTIYIGGGTPSILSVELFNKIMEAVKKTFDLSMCEEFTIEVNPGTVTEALVEAYINHGVNRISMGLQSDEDAILKDIGRIHDYDTFLNTYHLLQDSGLTNISVDLMFALPGQDLSQWNKTLEHVVALKPNHISAYSLIVEEGTVFEKRYNEGNLMVASDEDERTMFWTAHDYLEKHGYHHYEISNYAIVGKEAIHNSRYWDLSDYMGVGLGAASYVNGVRYKNISELETYIQLLSTNETPLYEVRVVEQAYSLEAQIEEVFFLGLRQMDGLDIEGIVERFGDVIIEPYYDVISDLIKEGYLLAEDVFLTLMNGTLKPMAKRVKLSRSGIDFSNQVLSRFLLD